MHILSIARKFIYLVCATMFCFAIATFGSGLAPVSMLTARPGTFTVDPWQAFVPVFIFSFVIAALFGYIIMRSRWHGLSLALSIFLAFFGLMTVVGQLESLVFLRNQMPAGLLYKVVLMGFIFAGLFSPLAVMIMGGAKSTGIIETSNSRLIMPIPVWVWKAVVIGVSYVALYFVFGYFLAWKNPVIQQYYGGSDPGSFLSHLNRAWHFFPWMFPFQFLRGLLWMLFAMPIIRMHRGAKWEVSLTLALLFSFWSFQLLMPNPIIPAAVAHVHLIETFSSNFILGWLIGLLLA